MYHNTGSKKCISVDFEEEWDLKNTMIVEEGTACGTDKICLNFQCRNMFDLIKDQNCTSEVTCHRRGLCNNRGHCHCYNGWSPPYCITRGNGGSIDSERTAIISDMERKEHQIINVWLLIGFCIIFPLLLLILSILIKACCIALRNHRRRKRQSMQNPTPISEAEQSSSATGAGSQQARA
ncbi:disintegrin and metalloproteinase domain-containing protein 9-like [Rhinatrema bivittatum]|uniref:disintegrin and metalloproteinase domain-containing protein 9-like n=1 Tax=Rhinatrema bivittatum TaxID=194408 RepID=UPI00112A80AD|nr:disintegrin and metalloproteinase domain-containing protein 9-like [Rhinatrema bivittatum]